MRTIAYLVPHATHFTVTPLRHEIEAVEAQDCRVLRFALRTPVQSDRRAWNEPERPLGLRKGSSWRQHWQGLKAAWANRRSGGPALRLLLRDIWCTGLADRRAWSLPADWLVAARWVPVLRANGCDHIHAHVLQGSAHVAMYAAAMSGLPFTATAHSHDTGAHTLLVAEVAARAQKLLTTSQANREALLARGANPDKVEVVRSSLPAPLLGRVRPRRSSGPFHIGTSGRLTAESGIADLLDAMVLLRRTASRTVRLYVAGEGPERLRLQVKVDQLGLHRQVEFLGRVPTSEIGPWLNMLDAFVMPGRERAPQGVEDIPATLMEAMSRGLVVVCTRLWDLPELVQDGRTGYLVEPGDAVALAQRLGEAMRDPVRARALGHAARAHMRWEFSRERHLRGLMRHFGGTPVPATQPAALVEAA